MQGMLLIDKPAGWTSFDVVNYIRKQVAAAEGKKPKNVKVGHAGTLDPFATGLLIVLIGKEYTRRASEFSKLDKTYEVTMRLGETSTTGDPEGVITKYDAQMLRHPELVSGTHLRISKDIANGNGVPKRVRHDVNMPTEAEIQAAFKQFTGEIEQVPPAYSAIKINGQRAYKLARAGKEVIIEPRKITIHKLELIKYDYPEVTFTAEVSSGTYIRTLVEDLGQTLRCGAYTKHLRRTVTGAFLIRNTHDIYDEFMLNGLMDTSFNV